MRTLLRFIYGPCCKAVGSAWHDILYTRTCYVRTRCCTDDVRTWKEGVSLIPYYQMHNKNFSKLALVLQGIRLNRTSYFAVGKNVRSLLDKVTSTLQQCTSNSVDEGHHYYLVKTLSITSSYMSGFYC